MSDVAPILEVRGLGITVGRSGRAVQPVTNVSFTIRAGETLGLMGRSGAGKTLTALALLHLLPARARITNGKILWKGDDVAEYEPRDWQRVRGAQIAMIFQDPMTALHPLHRVDYQVAEALRAHRRGLTRRDALVQAGEMLEQTGVPRSRLVGSGHAFEWSGGMRQRAVIAMAMANRPALLIADEPTTALDVTTQARILKLLKELQQHTGMAILFITHDPAVIAEVAERVAILRDGRIVDSGPVDAVLRLGANSSTAEASASDAARRGPAVTPAATPADSPRHSHRPPADEVLRVEDLKIQYTLRGAARDASSRIVRAVDGVSFALHAGEVLGIVGETGCGKSTLARALVRLESPAAGRVLIDRHDLALVSSASLRHLRTSIQIVFQDPYASLNPRRSVGESIALPLRVHGRYHAAGGAVRVQQLLAMVGLPPAYASRFPHELSGGERQRVAIARALAIEPRVLVLDEPASSLDLPTRSAVMRLLQTLQQSLGLACVLIAHDLRLVREMAHRIAVMYLGRFVEMGPTASTFESPLHPYTQALLAAMPNGDPAVRAERKRFLPRGDVPDATRPPAGCHFHPRCWKAEAICAERPPDLAPSLGTGRACACHFAPPPDGGNNTVRR